MDDVVCVKVKDKTRGTVFVMTWGRVFDPIDPKPLFKALRQGLQPSGLREIKSMHLCDSLAEGAAETFFYEALISFAQKPIPFGRETYWRWTEKTRRAIENGKEIHVITDSNQKSRRPPKGISGTMPNQGNARSQHKRH
jgi:hypothetical protein